MFLHCEGLMSVTVGWIDGQVMIPDLLRASPQARPVLDRYGLRGCGGALGPVETLEFFARSHDVPLPALLAELRQASTDSAPSPPLTLPSPPSDGGEGRVRGALAD